MPNNCRSQLLQFGLLIGVLYFVVSPGYLTSIDAAPSIDTAMAILKDWTFSIEPKVEMGGHYFQSATGETFSRMGIGSVLFYLFPCALSILIAKLANIPQTIVLGFLVSFLTSMMAAFCVLLVFYAHQLSGRSNHKIWIAGTALGFGTLMLPGSKLHTRDMLQCFAMTLAAVGWLLQDRNEQEYRWWGLFGSLAAAFGILVKQTFILTLLPLFVARTYRNVSLGRRAALWNDAFVLSASILILFAHQYFVFGGILETGYSQKTLVYDADVWKTGFLSGVYQQLFAINSGLFILCPVLLLLVSAIIWHLMHRKASVYDFAFCGAIALQAAFYAKWYSPLGSSALGPRYLIAVLPLFFLVGVFHKDFGKEFCAKPWIRSIGIAVLVLSVSMQLLFSVVKSTQARKIINAGYQPGAKSRALIYVDFKLLTHKLFQDDEIYCFGDLFFNHPGGGVDVSGTPTWQGFDLWVVHSMRLRKSVQYDQSKISINTPEVIARCGEPLS